MGIKFLSYVPAILGVVSIAFFVLFNNPNNNKNRIFALWNVFTAAWLFFLFMADISTSETSALWLLRFALFFGSLVFLFFYFFSLVFPTQRKINLVRQFIYTLPLTLVALLSFTPYVVSSVTIADFGVQPQDIGFAYAVSDLVGLFYLLLGVVIMLTKYRKASAKEKSQVKFVLFGIAVATVVNVFTGIILTLLRLDTNLILFGSFSLFIFSLFVAYSIIKHRFFDIRLAVARSVAYMLLLTTLGSLYGLAIFGLSSIFFADQLLNSTQQFAYIILAIIVAFTFQPLRKFFEKLTDRIFYRDKYDSREVVEQLGGIFASQIDIAVIIENSLKIISGAIKPIRAQIVVLDEHRIYRTANYGGDSFSVSVKELKQFHHNVSVADELEGGEIKRLMANRGLALVSRLITQEGVVGYILLGSKQNGSIYVNQDVSLLETAGPGLAVAIQNARSFEKIADFNLTLQERIKEATKRLRYQNQRLKELDEAKDEFISMASHQLRTPLTSIKGYLSMLNEGDAGKLSSKQGKFADLAYTSAQRMVYLIADMLNVSRINTGKLVIDKNSVDLEKVVRDEIRQLERTAKAHGVNIKLSTPHAKLPKVELDEGKMRQVIMNFLDNAMYYSPNSTIEVKLEAVSEKLRFSVKDHGIGVPKAEKEKLFKKFYRAPNAKKARPDGTGLGLYMAKMVVELQGGNIIFDSTEGKGSTFGFEFPLREIISQKPAKPATKK